MVTTSGGLTRRPEVTVKWTGVASAARWGCDTAQGKKLRGVPSLGHAQLGGESVVSAREPWYLGMRRVEAPHRLRRRSSTETGGKLAGREQPRQVSYDRRPCTASTPLWTVGQSRCRGFFFFKQKTAYEIS